MIAFRLMAGLTLLFASAFELRSSFLTSCLKNLGTSMSRGQNVSEPLLHRFRPSAVPGQIEDFRTDRTFELASSNEKPQDPFSYLAKTDEFAVGGMINQNDSGLDLVQAHNDANVSHAMVSSSFSAGGTNRAGGGRRDSANLTTGRLAASGLLIASLPKNGIATDSVSALKHTPDAAGSEEDPSATPDLPVQGQNQFVPDSGTSVSLLGLGVVGVVLFRRKLG